MASSLATTSTTTTTQEEEYFQRLCKLLIEEGTEVMRQEFDLIIPPANFPRILRQGRTTLTKLPRNVFTPTMDETLYSRAPISYGCSKHCDISLLMVLFRNLCRLNPPASTGNWTDMPSSNDCSLEADLVRLKLFRNELFAHTKKCSVQESEFQRHWTDISSVILRRGNHVGMVWTNKINDILTNPLSAHGKRWVENLKNWYLDDRDLKKMFGERIDLLREDLDLFKEEFNRKLQVNDSLPKAYGAIVLTFKHNSSIPELSWREDASVIDKIATIGAGTAAAVCGICVYLPLKGVGELLTLSYWTVKEIFKNILETRGEIKSIEKSCIKIYFELKSKQDLKELIIDVEKRTLHKYLAIAIQMESSKFKVFHGVNVHINQDHFVVTIQTLKGTTVDLKNYRQLSHEIKTQDLEKVLLEAAESNNIKSVEMALKAGVDPDNLDNNGNSSLHLAVICNRKEVVKTLLAAGANVNMVNNNGETALQKAVQFNNSEMVETLTNNGANTDFVDKNGETVLHKAARLCHLEIVNTLTKNGAKLDLLDKEGQTALHKAVKSGHLEIVRILINSGANLNILDEGGDCGKTSLLFQLGEMMTTPQHQWGRSPLCEGTRLGSQELVETLIAAGADVNLSDRWGRTPLYEAARLGNHELMNTLISSGASLNLSDQGKQKNHTMFISMNPVLMDQVQ